jgi:hypothetical protein
MASEWFYTLNGEKHGPVSSQELRRLAQAGTLSPTDLLWKEGMKEWCPASQARKLFDGVSTPGPVVPKAAEAEATSASPSTKAQSIPKAAGSLGARMQNAARITALKAEQTKLTTVSLPAAYVGLGKYLYSARLLAEHFPELYQQLDDLKAQAAEASKKSSEATGTNFTEKAKALAQKGAELAKSKAAEVQQLAVFRRLGEAASEGTSSGSVDADRLKDIMAIRERVAAISDMLSPNALQSPANTTMHPSVLTDSARPLPWKRRLGWIGGTLGTLACLVLVVSRGLSTRPSSDSPRSAPATTEAAGVVPLRETNSAVAEAITSMPEIRPRLGDRLSKRNPSAPRRGVREDRPVESPEPQSATKTSADAATTTPSGPTKGELQMADAVLKELYTEQKLLPVSVDGPIGLLPQIPRIKITIPVQKSPHATYDTGSRHITQLHLGVVPDTCIVNDSLRAVPSLGAVALDNRNDSLERLTIYRIGQQEAKKMPVERHFDGPDRAQFSNAISQGRICGERVVRLADQIFAVVQRSDSALAITNYPTLMFWTVKGSLAELLDGFPLRAEPTLAGGAVAELFYVQDAYPWNGSAVLMTSARFDEKGEGSTLEVWQTTGRIGSMQLTKQGSESEGERPYGLSVCDKTGAAALLYSSALRILDLKKCTEQNMALSVGSEVAFDEPAPFRNANGHRLMWTNDGQYCVVQREAKNPTGGDSVVLEVYDNRSQLVGRLDGERAAYLGDIANDGKSIAVHRTYRPMPGVDSTFVEPEEVELLTLPGLESIGKVCTCFAKRIRLLDEGVVVTGGVSDEAHNRLLVGDWMSQQMNQLVGGHYVTFWDMRQGRPIRRIKDVDVDDVICSIDGKIVLTTRRAHNNEGATVCVWRTEEQGDGDEWVDEFAVMRRKAIETEKDRRKRITLPAPPIESEMYEEIKEGQSYYDVKERLGGAGRMTAEIIVKDTKPMIVAVVDFDVSGHENAVYRLTFESIARKGPLRVENDIKLVRKERVE